MMMWRSGANTTIDRGANCDTIIGEGTKIDNLVQIAHNVVIGRSCIIVSQVGIAGSTTLGDFVALGGHSAIAGHLRIGDGAQNPAAAEPASCTMFRPVTLGRFPCETEDQ